jgi:4-aminobutyrate aminotransferase-like enzyme
MAANPARHYLPSRNVLKIRPPLVFGREHADLLLQTLDEVLAPPSC